MARGLKKHLKRLNAPRHWMLDKLGGAFAPKPSSGPHKSRECLPLILILRNRLKYALTYREVQSILMQRHVMVDGKVRTDKTYPAGFMEKMQGLLGIYKDLECCGEYEDIQVMWNMIHSSSPSTSHKTTRIKRVSYWIFSLCFKPSVRQGF